MGLRIVPEGIELSSLWHRPRVIHFDEITRVEGARLIVGQEKIRAGNAIVAEVEQILRGPAAEAKAVEEYVRVPHASRVAARALLSAAEATQASDLHIEPTPTGALVRARVEGELGPFCALPASAVSGLVAAMKGLAGCLPYRADIVQEGRIPREGVGADIRASFVPAAFGERVALRLFGRLRALDDLGLPPETFAAFDRLLATKTGLVLVAGATGSGKTTTIYAALKRLAEQRPGAHLSLEDPVEQRLRLAGIPVDQIELNPARGLTGDAMLVAALRQDIDVLAVGEVRTPAEAQLALQAAHTGRLVLAGVHAGSCEEARQRMLDLGVDGALLARTLRGVLHQSFTSTPCGCEAEAVCARCRGARRRRVLQTRLLQAPPTLEVVA